MHDAVEVHLLKETDLSGYTLIEGFPGIGLIGTIAVGYLTEKTGAEIIGYITSRKFPPMASIHKGAPVFPARMYVDKKRKVVLLFSEFVIPSNAVYELSETILAWARKAKISRIISLAGMTARTGGQAAQIYGIASTPEIAEQLQKKDVHLITEGVTTGVSGILMARCGMEGIPAFSLLIETEHGYPDPGAAAVLLEKLEEFVGFEIKTEALVEEAKQIETKMKNMMEQVKLGKQKYEQAEGEPLPMYR
jgi:uncharacterized protein